MSGAHAGWVALVESAARTSVGRLIRQQARIGGARTAIESADRRVSYAELDDRSRRLATMLSAPGVGAGDRVAVLSENRPEMLELLVAAARMGAVVACQSWRLAPPELAHCLAIVDPVVILASERFAGPVPDGAAPHRLVFGRAYEARLAATQPEVDIVNVDPEAPLLILYTSGTTGLPKGAVLRVLAPAGGQRSRLSTRSTSRTIRARRASSRSAASTASPAPTSPRSRRWRQPSNRRRASSRPPGDRATREFPSSSPVFPRYLAP